jgi:hypothetical protein
MRALIVCSLVAAAVAATASSASAFRRSYAVFKVSVTGTQTSTVNGQEQCQDELGTVAAAKATSNAEFSTITPRKLEFAKAGKAISVVNPGAGDISNTRIGASGTLTRQSDFVPNGSTPPVCQGGQPGPGCGSKTISHMTLLVQGGVNSVHLSASGLRPSPGLCLLPTVAFPEMPGAIGGLDNLHVHYSAKVPSSLLNTRKHVVTIHGHATATTSGQQGAIIVSSAQTTLNFTMRLVRVPLR